MALIQCPYCGQQISEKATTCVYCGAGLKEEPVAEKVCPECGEIVSGYSAVCPKCGYPINEATSTETQKVEVTNLNNKKSSKKKIVLLFIAVIAIIIVVAGYKYAETENAKLEYEQNYNEAVMLMAGGTAYAEATCTLIHEVWYNCIFEKSNSDTDEFTKDSRGRFYDDFNDALGNLWSSSVYERSTEEISENLQSVLEIMKEMKNPPKGYEDSYQALKELYDAYGEYMNLAINPSGNLTSYTEAINELDSKMVKLFKEAMLYVE